MKSFLDANFEELVIAIAIAVLAIVVYNSYVIVNIAYFYLKKQFKGQKQLDLNKSEKKEHNEEKVRLEDEKVAARTMSIIERAYFLYGRTVLGVSNFFRSFFSSQYSFYVINIFLIIFVWVCVYGIMYRDPKVLGSSPANGGQLKHPEQEIEVYFSRPVQTHKVTMNLGPDIRGEWERDKLFGFLPLTTKMTFHPKETVMLENDMILYVVGFNPKDIGEHLIEFKSASLPRVESVSIQEGSENVPVDAYLEFTFDRDLNDAVRYSLQTSPEFEYETEIVNNKLRFMPLTRLDLDTDYVLNLVQQRVSYDIQTREILEQLDTETIYSLSFKTDSTALIKNIQPLGEGVFPEEDIFLEFGKEIDQKQVVDKLSFEPDFDYSLEWETDSKLIIVPEEGLQKAQKYKVVLAKGIAYDDVETMSDYVFEFETIGAVKVRKFTPENNISGVSVNQVIRVEFDQPVDQNSAQENFLITPSVNGSFSWDENTLIFDPEPLSYNTRYEVSISPGIKSVYGLDSQEEFSTFFTTQSEIFSLSVPYYRQVQRFECELLSIRMILAYRGVYLSTNQVLDEIGVDPTPYDPVNNIWGDPSEHFVGDVTGANPGYGVHLEPLARLAQNYGRQTRILRNSNYKEVVAEVAKGNPVFILAQNGYSTPTNKSWYTPEGRYVHAINGTHAYVLVGFKGSVSEPTALLLQDPWYRGGSKRWFTISYFNSLWQYHSNSALVVY